MNPVYCTFLIGLPGAGKSTYTKDIKNAVIVSTDNYIEHIAEKNGTTYSAIFLDQIKAAEEHFYQHIKGCIKANRNIIIDRTNLTVKGRRKLMEFIKKEGRENKVPVIFHAIEFITPDDTEHKRRLNSRPGKIISDDFIAKMKKSYQRPTIDEGFYYIFTEHN